MNFLSIASTILSIAAAGSGYRPPMIYHTVPRHAVVRHHDAPAQARTGPARVAPSAPNIPMGSPDPSKGG
jgi:hypothetical protein